MILRLFRRKSKANEAVVLRTYEAIVASARQKRFYAQFHVPDTPIGRYEMLSIHVFLTLRRMKDAEPALKALAQEVADEFFKDVDHSLRELGIGDQGVPKRMKKLARMFYGRVATYGEALDAGDRPALRDAITRNIRPDFEFWPEAPYLAEYVFASAGKLALIADNDLVAGGIEFADAEQVTIESEV